MLTGVLCICEVDAGAFAPDPQPEGRAPPDHPVDFEYEKAQAL